VNDSDAEKLFDAVSRKSVPDIRSLNKLSDTDLTIFEKLIEARGDQKVITEFRDYLQESDIEISERCAEAFEQLLAVSEHISKKDNAVLHLDLSELHGYFYHTGLTFQFFVEGEGRAIAKGGRYMGQTNSTGQNTEQARYATGFSSDLNVLSRLS